MEGRKEISGGYRSKPQDAKVILLLSEKEDIFTDNKLMEDYRQPQNRKS